MNLPELCLYSVLAYFALQLIVACCIRIHSNGVLIDPQLRSKKNLRGYYAIVTGSNQGIGYEVARYLAKHGAYVVLACRNNERGKKAEQRINNDIKLNAIYKGGKAEYIQCDLSKLSSTKSFIQQYKDKKYPLHLLINNAGFGGTQKAKFTEDGINMTWQINYLSHFLITYELLPVIIDSNKDKRFDCRIVNTSSFWHKYGYLDIDTLKSDRHTQARRYKGQKEAYGTSKLAQILHATYLQTEVFTKLNIDVSICSLHPGGVRSNIWKLEKQKVYIRMLVMLFYPSLLLGMRSNERGSRNSIYCAVAPIGNELNKWGGQYVPGAYHVNMKAHITGDVEGQSTCPKAMKRLYQYSLDVLGLERRTKDDYMKLMHTSVEDEPEHN